MPPGMTYMPAALTILVSAGTCGAERIDGSLSIRPAESACTLEAHLYIRLDGLDEAILDEHISALLRVSVDNPSSLRDIKRYW